MLELLAIRSTVRDLKGAVAAPRFRGEIVFEDVSLDYKKGTRALTGVTLRIAAGERVGLVGPSGAGKTSLASLIPRFYDPSRGRVLIDGHALQDLKLASVRQQISIVFQEPVLFAASIAENIGHGKPNASMDEIVAAAERLGIDRMVEQLADGYDTVLGERGGTLSGGQRQCVAIARAMIRDPAIVILDEPTVGLDARSAALVMDALGQLMEGRTVILISHELRNVRDADRVIVLESGRVVEQGDHESLLALGGLYHALQVSQSGDTTA